MDRVLITGSSGFVASHLIPYLQRVGFTTIGISRKKISTETLRYEELSSDIWNGASAMVHLAGKAHDLKQVSSRDVYFEANTELTKQVFGQFLESSASVFIYMSSVKAAADTLEEELIETIAPNPVTAYGQSKQAAELYLLSKELPKNKKVYILRPCMIHGPNNKGNLNLLFQFVKKGIPYPLGKFENQRSFLSIANLCAVIERLIQLRPDSGIYNVADDASMSTLELVQLMGEIFTKKPRIFMVPKAIIRGLASAGTFFKLPFNSERVQKLTESYTVSNRKIKETLGLELPVTLKEGLISTIRSFK
jgi:nucleoside-diphosphate-sugar epimerase